jgi:hypothetical protein
VSVSFSARMIEAAKAYFVAVDSGRLPDELFSRDFEFFFPKYGVGRGVDEFHALAAGLVTAGYKAARYRDRLKYLVSGQRLIVEGTTFGDGSRPTPRERHVRAGGAHPAVDRGPAGRGMAEEKRLPGS